MGGFHTEYSSIRFALFFLAEFMNTMTMSAIIVTLFLGGPAGPTFFGPDWIWGPIWFLAKLLVLPLHVRVVPRHAARGSATTSSWTWAGRCSSRWRSGWMLLLGHHQHRAATRTGTGAVVGGHRASWPSWSSALLLGGAIAPPSAGATRAADGRCSTLMGYLEGLQGHLPASCSRAATGRPSPSRT